MHFLDFCRLHGILVDREPPIGVWKRYPTEDKRHHRNGAVKFMGDHAFVQNHATETEISVWHSDGDSAIDPNKARKAVEAAARDIREKQQEAARKAASILNQCQIGFHPYLERKGFKEEQGNVWKTDDGLLLVIPMRVGHQLVGCQIIREDGEKKFLFGQVADDEPRMNLDTGCQLFQTLVNVPSEALVVDPADNMLVNTVTRTKPCVFHANGDKESAVYHKLLNHFGY